MKKKMLPAFAALWRRRLLQRALALSFPDGTFKIMRAVSHSVLVVVCYSRGSRRNFFLSSVISK